MKIHQAKSRKRPSISLDELTVQIALGTLQKPEQIAGFIAVTTDVKALIWASCHSSSKVREGAVRNPLCTLGLLVKLGLCDVSSAVRDSARVALIHRREEFKSLLFVIEEYPQLAFPFYHTTRIKTTEEVPAPPGSDQEESDDEIPF